MDNDDSSPYPRSPVETATESNLWGKEYDLTFPKIVVVHKFIEDNYDSYLDNVGAEEV